MRYVRFKPLDFGISLLLVYAFFLGLFTRYIPSIMNLVLLFGGLLCIEVKGITVIKRKQSFISMITIVCTLIVLINRNERFSNGFIRMDFCIIIAFITYFFLCNTDKWHQCYLRSMVYLGLFYGVTTIFLFLFPNIYMKYVLPLFPENTMTNIRLVERGYAVGFSNNFGTTAIYLVATISIPIVIFLRKDAVGKKEQKFFFFLSVMLYVAVLLTGKRAHALFVLFSGIIAYWCLNREKSMSRFFYVVGGILAIFGVYYVAAQFFPSLLNIVNRFVTKLDRGDVFSGRGVLISECITMFRENPLLGTGWGSYTYFTSSGLMNAHNVYVQLLAENGILLSSPFFLFIIVNYVHTMKSAMKAGMFTKYKKYKELSLLGAALFLQTFFLFYCFTGNPLYDFQMLFPYILSCAIGEYYYRNVYGTLVQTK